MPDITELVHFRNSQVLTTLMEFVGTVFPELAPAEMSRSLTREKKSKLRYRDTVETPRSEAAHYIYSLNKSTIEAAKTDNFTLFKKLLPYTLHSEFQAVSIPEVTSKSDKKRLNNLFTGYMSQALYYGHVEFAQCLTELGDQHKIVIDDFVPFVYALHGRNTHAIEYCSKAYEKLSPSEKYVVVCEALRTGYKPGGLFFDSLKLDDLKPNTNETIFFDMYYDKQRQLDLLCGDMYSWIFQPVSFACNEETPKQDNWFQKLCSRLASSALITGEEKYIQHVVNLGVSADLILKLLIENFRNYTFSEAELILLVEKYGVDHFFRIFDTTIADFIDNIRYSSAKAQQYIDLVKILSKKSSRDMTLIHTMVALKIAADCYGEDVFRYTKTHPCDFWIWFNPLTEKVGIRKQHEILFEFRSDSAAFAFADKFFITGKRFLESIFVGGTCILDKLNQAVDPSLLWDESLTGVPLSEKYTLLSSTKVVELIKNGIITSGDSARAVFSASEKPATSRKLI